MKNVIKKISALAMALTLLGAGTTISKAVEPNSDNTLTASADHICGTVRTIETYKTVITGYKTVTKYYFVYNTYLKKNITVEYTDYEPVYSQVPATFTDRCPICNQVFGHGSY